MKKRIGIGFITFTTIILAGFVIGFDLADYLAERKYKPVTCGLWELSSECNNARSRYHSAKKMDDHEWENQKWKARISGEDPDAVPNQETHVKEYLNSISEKANDVSERAMKVGNSASSRRKGVVALVGSSIFMLCVSLIAWMNLTGRDIWLWGTVEKAGDGKVDEEGHSDTQPIPDESKGSS